MKKIYLILSLFLCLIINAQNCNVICNGGFDSTNLAGSTVALITATNVPCWKTTSSDNKIEVWSNGYAGINSYSGIQFIEINATEYCTVYEEFVANPASNLAVSFAHRARGAGNIDSVSVSIGPIGGPYTSLGRFGDASDSWIYRTLNYTVPAGLGNNFVLRFTSLYVGNGNSDIGNFLDAVNVCSSINTQNCNFVCNGGFDSTNLAGSTLALITATNVPCWKTTSSDNKIEVWSNGYAGINSYSGIQFIEINATEYCTVYEEFVANPASNLAVSFAHRARGAGNIDSVLVSIGPIGGPYTSLGRFGDASDSWIYRTLNYTVPAGVGNNFALRFTSLYVGNGNPAVGNFLDGVKVCSSANAQSCDFVCNGGFDSTNLAGSTVVLITATNVPCWKTTSSDNMIEVWSNGYAGIDSYSGIQFIEINATEYCTVYEEFVANPSSNLAISFAHRARGAGNIDSVLVSFGPQGGPYTSLGRFGDASDSWIYRTLNFTVPTGVGNNFVLRFTSLYVGNGNPAVGNFLDGVKVCYSTVGIEELKLNSSFVISPNPCVNNFNIKLLNSNHIGKEMNLRLYDVQGKLVMEQTKNINYEYVNFDINGLTTGIYYYQGNVKGDQFSGKLIITE